MTNRPEVYYKLAEEAARLSHSYCDDKESHFVESHMGEAECIVDELFPLVLRAEADFLEQTMQGFKHNGQWTRASWAVNYMRLHADKLDAGSDL